MNYEFIKKEFVQLKKEELEYIDSISKISSKKILSEYEKIEIYRKIKKYEQQLNEVLLKLFKEEFQGKRIASENLEETVIEFDIDKKFLSSISTKSSYQKKILFENYLGINEKSYKYILTLYHLFRYHNYKYKSVDIDLILNNQKLIEPPIYIFCGYYDSSKECCGPLFGDYNNYIYGIYVDISDRSDKQEDIPKKKINNFEDGKIIIESKKYTYSSEVRNIFEEELLNTKNKSINDCVIATRKRINKLNYVRSPEYKEKVLLDKINVLYQKVRGDFIQKDVLYSGKFLEILKETYKLPNKKIVEKEKIIKNGGKNSVIVIAINQEKEYIITFQNRIKDEKIAEFPSGYIENGEDPITAANRELQEETGYISDDLFVVDEAFTSPGIDNSITYIVIANNCIKKNEVKTDGNELVNYGLFSEIELKYLISKNIMSGAMNKLAYYNLINNVDDCNVFYDKSNKKIYKRKKKKSNPLYE